MTDGRYDVTPRMRRRRAHSERCIRPYQIIRLNAAAMPLAARAQQAPMPVIGYISGRSLESEEHLLPSFRKGLEEEGYVAGKNVAIGRGLAAGQCSDRMKRRWLSSKTL